MAQSQFSSLIDRLKRELKSRLDEPNLSPDVFQAAVEMTLAAGMGMLEADKVSAIGTEHHLAHILRCFTDHEKVENLLSPELVVDLRSFVMDLAE